MIRIMIVEDRNSISEIMRDILLSNDYKVIGPAETGQEAIEMYLEFKPDLVLMDILLPDMSGIEATKGIIKKEPDAKIIAITALPREGIMEDCIKAGCRGFIVKPFRVTELIGQIEEVMR